MNSDAEVAPEMIILGLNPANHITFEQTQDDENETEETSAAATKMNRKEFPLNEKMEGMKTLESRSQRQPAKFCEINSDAEIAPEMIILGLNPANHISFEHTQDDENETDVTPAAVTKINRKELRLNEKIEVMKYLENHSQRQAAKFFGISKTSVNNIKKRKSEYLEIFETESYRGGDLCRKTRKTKNEKVNEATTIWYRKMIAEDVYVTGPMIKEAALRFSREFKVKDFEASSGWLDRFKRRNHISFAGRVKEYLPAVTVNAVREKFNEVITDVIQGVVAAGKMGNSRETLEEESSDEGEPLNASANDDKSNDLTELEAAQMLGKLKCFAMKNDVKMLKHICSAESCLNDYMISKRNQSSSRPKRSLKK